MDTPIILFLLSVILWGFGLALTIYVFKGREEKIKAEFLTRTLITSDILEVLQYQDNFYQITTFINGHRLFLNKEIHKNDRNIHDYYWQYGAIDCGFTALELDELVSAFETEIKLVEKANSYSEISSANFIKPQRPQIIKKYY